MLKKCSKCLRELEESNFNWKIRDIKLQCHCKDCSRKYVRNHYQNNIDYYIAKAKKRSNLIRITAYAYLGPYLLSHPCVDCGETDILVLEFDHRDRKMKEEEISHIIANGGNLDKITREIEKCDVRCSNCHRRKTAKEDNSWKLKYMRP
jgi:hypothetical protein